MTNAEARFNKSLRPRKPEGLLGRTAQDIHLNSHTAPELWVCILIYYIIYILLNMIFRVSLSPCVPYTIKHYLWQSPVHCKDYSRANAVYQTKSKFSICDTWLTIYHFMCDTKMFLLILLLITFMQRYSLLLSRLTALLMRVILNEWLAILQHILNISWSGVLTPLIVFGCYMAGAMWNCFHLSARSVYAMQPCTSLRLRC